MIARLQTILIFTAFLFASLMGYGPYVMMCGILLLCTLCLTISETRACFISMRGVCWFLAAISVVSGFYLYALVAPNAVGSSALEKSLTNNYLFAVLIVMFVFSLRALVHTHLKKLAGIFGALLMLNNVILLTQTVVLIVSKQYIDMILPVTGERSRYLNYEYMNPVFAYRPTGLFVEPSEFSAAVGAIAIGYILFKHALGCRPSNLTIGLTILCMLITQSTAAIIQSVILFVAVVLLHKGKSKIWFAASVALVLLAFPGVLVAYIDSFLMKFDATSGIRLALLDYIYNARHGWDYVFGFGPFSVENSLYGMAMSESDSAVASFNDSGLANYFVLQFGMVGLLIPLWMFCKMRKKVTNLLFFALLISSKLSYVHPVLYCGLVPLLMALPPPLGRETKCCGSAVASRPEQAAAGPL